MSSEPRISDVLAGRSSVAPDDEPKEKKTGRPRLAPRRGHPVGVPNSVTLSTQAKRDLAAFASGRGIPAEVEKGRAPDAPHLKLGTKRIRVWGRVAAHRTRFQVHAKLKEASAYSAVDKSLRPKEEVKKELHVPVVWHRRSSEPFTVTLWAEDMFEIIRLADERLEQIAKGKS